jgi:glutathione S-transferase
MSEFIVHTVPGSPFARSVMAALEEKGADWRIAPLSPGAAKQEPHISRHPFGRMPVLEHDGFLLYETQAILRYLDRVLPQPALTPADPRAAGRMDQLMNINDWYLFQGCAAVIAFQRIVGPRLLGMAADEAAVAAAVPPGRKVFAELSRLLDGQDYFAGPEVSLADLLLAPQLDLLSDTPEWAELSAGKPNLVGWLERMRRRRSLQATTWEKVAQLATA